MPPSRLLFVRPDAYGDLVLFEPTLRLVAQALPDARLAVIIQARFADVTPLIGGRVEWILADCDPYEQGAAGAPGLDALHRAVTAWDPDCVVAACFDKTWLEAVVASWTPAARTVALGPYELDTVSRLALEREIGADPATSYSEVVAVDAAAPDWEKNVALASHLAGRPVERSRPRLSVPAEVRARCRAWLETHAIAPGFLACFPAGIARVAIKAWPPERFAEVIAHAARTWGARTVLLGHEREASILDAVASGVERAGQPTPPRWVGRRGEIAMLAALLERAGCYLGNDTGAVHIAAALGRPVVGIYGGGHWPRFAAAGDPAISIVQPMACFGCEWDCLFGNAPCVGRLPSAAVSEALGAVLNGTSPPGAQTIEVNTFSDGEGALVAEAARARGFYGQGHAAGPARLARDARSVATLISQLESSERDRAARLTLIERQGAEISALHAEVDRWLTEARRLSAALADAEALRGREVERHTREAAEHRAELDRLAQQVSAAAAQLRHTELERDAARLAHDDVRAQFTVCQADRAARLEVIQQQGLRIAALQAEIDRLLRQAEREAAGQRAREAEHTARIQALQAEHAAHIQSLQAEHTAQVRTLELERDAARRAHDDVRAQFTVCQADRAARLEVIQQQGLQVSALHAEVDRWLKAAQALQAERDRLAGLQAVTAAQLAELESRPVVRLLRRIGLIPPPGTGANRKTTP